MKINKRVIIASLLESFVDEGGFKEQDFLKGVHDMLVGDSPEQVEARQCITRAISLLNDEDAQHTRKG